MPKPKLIYQVYTANIAFTGKRHIIDGNWVDCHKQKYSRTQENLRRIITQAVVGWYEIDSRGKLLERIER